MEQNEQIKISYVAISYIAGWIIAEVDDYGGTTINDLPVETEPKPMKSLNDYNDESLKKAIILAIEAWNGGARDG